MERIRVGNYEFEMSVMDMSSNNFSELISRGGLGCGIICYRGGKYIGYFGVSEELLESPLEQILHSSEFKQKFEGLIG